jgi:hypothetical protein
MIDSLGRGSKEDFQRSDRYLKRGQEVLKKLSAFEMNLVDTNGSVIAASSSNHAGVKENVTDYHTTFNEDPIINHTVDPNKLDDIEDGRDV